MTKEEKEMNCNLCIMRRCSECKCVLTIKQLENENAELKEQINQLTNYLII